MKAAQKHMQYAKNLAAVFTFEFQWLLRYCFSCSVNIM